MRFLIYQDKQCPGWAYDQTKETAEEFGHSFVRWEAHLQLGKDFDGVLVFPRPASCLDHVCKNVLDENDEDDDDIRVRVGRGVYEGLVAKRPHTYVVCYDTDDDDEHTIQLLQGYELERGNSSDDYNNWGMLWFHHEKIKSSSIRVSFKMLEKGILPKGATTSIIGEARRLLLLLLNR